MKKIIYALLATVSGLVLLFGYRTSHEEVVASTAIGESPAAADTTASSAPTTGTDAAAGAGSATGTTTSSGTDATATSTGRVDGTFTGDAVRTRYGPVQVQITVTGGVISDVQVPEYPSGNARDRQINERALPTLIAETTSAQSSVIDMVSGATYTSDGYIQSLQSALDQAQA